MMTDPIADMLTRIRNAQMSKKQIILIPFSKVKLMLAHILSEAGYIGKVQEKDGMPRMIEVELKYTNSRPAITSIKRESSPGHRKYSKAEELPRILNGYGMLIVSTSQGIMSGDEARKKGIGGEIICSVY